VKILRILKQEQWLCLAPHISILLQTGCVFKREVQDTALNLLKGMYCMGKLYKETTSIKVILVAL